MPSGQTLDAGTAEFVEADAMSDFYACAPAAFVRDARVIAARVGSLRVFAVATIPSAFFNRIVGLGVAEPATPATLDDAIALLEGAGCRRYMVQVSEHARPGDLPQWLAERGLVAGRNWVKMTRDRAPAPEVPTDLRIEAADPSDADAFAAVALDAFSMPGVLGHMMGAHLGKPGWRSYLAFDGEKAVAAASLRVAGKVGWLGLGCTLASHRGRGAQGALLARRVRDGIAAGCRRFVTETGEPLPDEPNPSYNNMIRAGFESVYLRRNYVKQPGG